MEQYEGQINQEYMNPTGLTQFQMIPTSDIYSDHRQQYHVSLSDHHQVIINHDALVLPVTLTNQLDSDFCSDHLGAAGLTPAASTYGFDIAASEDTGSGIRWPRQETLTLLEIRSSLDSKFKEANQKAPLWDQVSRIMVSEHGYCRSGKKCKEKFENLYKYYKKTKYGKVGKQQQKGNHYRFFRQLESLYGETDQLISSNEIQSEKQPSDDNNNHNNLTLFNSFGFDTSSSCDEHYKDKLKNEWKVKMKSLIDVQMRKLVEKQEEWLEKVLQIIERKEQERVLKEEEWRMLEAARVEKECEFWAKERACIEARDVAIMEAFGKLAQERQTNAPSQGEQNQNNQISRLIG